MLGRIKKIWSALGKKEQRALVAAVVLGVISLGTLTATKISDSTVVVPARGGTYVEGVVGQPVGINPVTAATETDKTLVRLIFSSLSDVAEKIESLPEREGRIWRIRLKEGVLWHNGEKLTSDDVIFTVRRIQESAELSPLFSNFQGVAAERLSELELQFITSRPYAFFESTLKNLFIAPKYIFGNIPLANWRLSEFNLEPIGSGPFVFASMEKDKNGFIRSYRLKANERHVKSPPLISNFIVRFFTKTEEAVESFNDGEADGVAGVGAEDIAKTKRPHELISLPFLNYYAIFLNQSKNTVLKDASVREALSLAIDKKHLVEVVLGDYGHPVDGPLFITREKAGGTESASELLDRAGWTVREDGVREKTENKKTTELVISLTVPQVPFLVKTAGILESSWKAAGIKVETSIQSPKEVTETIIKNRDYEMLLFGNVLNQSKDLFSFWHSSERFHPGLNLAIYSSKKADAEIEGSRQNFSAEERERLLEEAQKTILADSPAIFLYRPDYLYLTGKNLKGLSAKEEISSPGDRFRNVEKWYLETTRVWK